MVKSSSENMAGGTPSVYENCPKHGRYVSCWNYFGSFKMVPCPECVREVEERNKRRQAEARLQELIQRAAIPPRFKTKTIESYEAKNRGQAAAKTVAANYLKDFDRCLQQGTSLMLCGQPGTGKTHLACAIANALIRSGHSALFTSASEIVRTVRASWQTNGEAAVLHDFCAPDLLIIDEVGVQSGTENEKQILFSVLNARYEEMRPVIVMSNLPVQGLKAFLGDRSFDRLRDAGGRAVSFDWESYRR